VVIQPVVALKLLVKENKTVYGQYKTLGKPEIDANLKK